MFGRKALGWMAGASIWMPGALGKRTLFVPSSLWSARAATLGFRAPLPPTGNIVVHRLELN